MICDLLAKWISRLIAKTWLHWYPRIGINGSATAGRQIRESLEAFKIVKEYKVDPVEFGRAGVQNINIT